MEEIKTVIEDFYSQKSDKTFEETVEKIRSLYASQLTRGFDASQLSIRLDNSSFRTLRGKLWGIFLRLGKFDAPNETELFGNVKSGKYFEMKRNIQGEVSRIKKGEQRFNGINIDEYSGWLTLFSGFTPRGLSAQI